MMPIHLEEQIVPGTFEHTIDYLVDKEIDLSVFEHRYSIDIVMMRPELPSVRSRSRFLQDRACCCGPAHQQCSLKLERVPVGRITQAL